MNETFNYFLENCPRKDQPVGNLYEYWEHVSGPEDAWMVAGLIALIREESHQVKPERKGWDCLAQNAKTVFLARFFMGQGARPIQYDSKHSLVFCDASGTFVDNNFKNYLSFEGSIPLLYQETEERDHFKLPLGSATIQERWQIRNSERVMFGHVRTLIEVSDCHAVWLNGTTAGRTSVILVGSENLTRRWTVFPHRYMTPIDMITIPAGDEKNRSWIGVLR